jgi:Ribonuclease G/E
LRPELPAALVEVGFARPGFLSAEDIVPKGGFAKLHQGQAVVVMVAKDARAEKAAGLTMKISGKSIEPPPGAKPPLRLDIPAPDAATLIASWLESAPDQIRIDNRAAYAELRHWLMAGRKELVERLVFYPEKLYEASGIGEALDRALAHRVELSGGGALTIEATSLGIAIDVDSGAVKSALAVNLAAASEVARQIRLRNLSGPILVGFVGMRGRDNRERVSAALKRDLARHAPDCQALGWTRLGHVELVRKRQAKSLAELAGEPAAPVRSFDRDGLRD